MVKAQSESSSSRIRITCILDQPKVEMITVKYQVRIYMTLSRQGFQYQVVPGTFCWLNLAVVPHDLG